jgi:putative Holliday junction resolvase
VKNDLDGYVVALDVGERRIGLAITHTDAKLPKPLKTLQNDAKFFDELNEIISTEQVVGLVVGIPRDMIGNDTAQTESTKKFIEKLKDHVKLPIFTQDEAVTSVLAEERLMNDRKGYNKEMIDAEAAAIILKDFLIEPKVRNG